MNRVYFLIVGIILFSGCIKNNNAKMEVELKQFISKFDSSVYPLVTKMNTAYWNAAISGNENEYAKCETYQKQLTQLLSNKADFDFLKKVKNNYTFNDSLLNRQFDVIYDSYLSNQADTAKLNEIIELETEVEKKYSTFRAEIGGKKYSDNEIEEILGKSTNSDELKCAWEAHKKIGGVVEADIINLVKKRNEVAVLLGFKNYHDMSLRLSEQNPDEIEQLFNELDSLTRGSFISLKNEIDTYLANRINIKKEELMPWHYQNRFFQEAPAIYKADLDVYYKNKNLEQLTHDYYKSIGLEINDMLANSDLYEKPNKNQHAFCTDINNEGDIRVLCNIKPNQYWMNTMLHEFGHAVYDKYISRDLPLCLREPAHTFTTEAIAMIFGRLSRNPQWLKDMAGISETEKAAIATDCYKSLRLEQLVFSRWAQVMYRFEKAMYANPNQDLNALWWQLVEMYQMIKKPEGRNAPDWASKIHIATSPCYYHNYLLGELLASQLHYYICDSIIKTSDYKMVSYYNQPKVGEFLTNKVFKPGLSLYWNTMIEKATGEKLTAKYYAKQFVD